MRRAASGRRPLGWLFVLVVAVAGVWPVAAATAPDWVMGAIRDSQGWVPKSRAQILLSSETIRFQSAAAERIVGTIRRVVHSESNQQIPNVSGVAYLPHTGRIISANAWIVSADLKSVEAIHRGGFVDASGSRGKMVENELRVIALDAASHPPEGGYVAWEVQYERSTPFNDVRFQLLTPIECRRAEVEVSPFPGGIVEWSVEGAGIAPAVPGVTPGALKWFHENIHPGLANPPFGFLQNPLAVNLRCVPQGTESSVTWQKFGRSVAGFTDPQIDPSGTVGAIAQTLVAGKSDRWDRIRALASFVQQDIVYLSVDLDQDSLEGMRPHPAAEVLRNRYGDCKDKANLLLSLLRAIGEDGRLVLLNGAGNPTAVDPKWPGDFFSHVIVAMPVGADVPAGWPVASLAALGPAVVFDPTHPHTPLGVLPRSDQGGYGLLVDAGHSEIFALPMPTAATPIFLRTAACEVDPEGGLKVHLTDDAFGVGGAEAYERRAHQSKEDFIKGLEARIDHLTPSATFGPWTESWSPALPKFRVEVDYTAPLFGARRANGMLMVAPTVLTDLPRLPAWSAQADGSVFLMPGNRQEEFVFSLPVGFRVEEIPDAFTSDRDGIKATITYAAREKAVACTMAVAYPGGFYSREAYERLRNATRQLLENAKRPIIFMHLEAPGK